MSKTMEAYNEETRKIISYADCPYQVFTADHTAEDVMEGYWQAVERGRTEGFTPLLVVSSDTIAETLEYNANESYSKEEVIQQQGRSGEEILKKRWDEYLENYADDFGEEPDQEEMLGEKAGGEEISALSSFCSYTDKGIEETVLLEIPVKNPWEVIAWVPMGGWNECPAVEDMMEACRHWYEKYGAVPALVSSDTLELVLEKPVSDEEEAWKVAKEHFAFCTDRVDQGTESGTIGELADCISKSTVWFFWWD